MKWIVLHHSAVSRDKNDNQFDAIANYHKEKWWGDKTWYHYLIEPNWEIKKWRDESEMWAHTVWYNDMIWICLTGHFDEEEPTEEQEVALTKLVREIKERHWKIKVYPHNKFASYKTCPWANAMYMINEVNVEVWFEFLTAEQKTDKLKWINNIKKSINS